MADPAIFGRKLKDAKLQKKTSAQKKRPVRGDNRTGQAIWALGVDGRSRLI